MNGHAPAIDAPATDAPATVQMTEDEESRIRLADTRDDGFPFALRPEEVSSREFVVSLRGYVREEVRAFLRGVADELAERDRRIEALERELSVYRDAERVHSAGRIGEEVAEVLRAAEQVGDAIVSRARAEAGLMREQALRFRSGLDDINALVEMLTSEADEAIQRIADFAGLAAPPSIVDLRPADTPPTRGA